MQLLQNTVTFAKNYYEKAGATDIWKNDSRIVSGEGLYILAVLQLTRGSKLKGALNLRKSWKIIEQILKDQKAGTFKVTPELERIIQFGAGFFYFVISVVPANLLKILEAVGFHADRDLGLQYLRECNEKGGIRGAYASIVLLFNDLLLPRGLADVSAYLAEAEQLIKVGIAKYPQGAVFQIMGSQCARKQCDIEKGITYMLAAMDNCKRIGQAPLFCSYELANCYATKLEWAQAATIFEQLITNEKFNVSAMGALQYGSMLVMMGQYEKAVEIFDKRVLALAKATKKGSVMNNTIQHQSKRYAITGGNFSAFELLYFRRDLAKMSPALYDKTLKLLDTIAEKVGVLNPPQAQNPDAKKSGGFAKLSKVFTPKASTYNIFDERASYLMLKASVLKASNKTTESMAIYQEVIDLEKQLNEKYFVPYCLYEMGETYYHQGKNQLSAETMKRASSYHGYDWEDPLKIRLRVVVGQLKKTGQNIDIVDDSPVDNDESKEDVDE